MSNNVNDGDWNAARVADTLLTAERSRVARTSIRHEWAGLTLDVAYPRRTSRWPVVDHEERW